MGSGQAKAKVVRGALERITALEGDFQRFIQALQEVLEKNFQSLNERVTALEEVAQALVDLADKDKVKAQIEANRLKRVEIQAATARTLLNKAVEQGLYVATDTITDKTLLVGIEKDKEGKVLPPSRVQVPFDNLKPEYQVELLNKGPGAVVNTDTGTFEVTEVYLSVKKDAPVQAAEPEAVLEDEATETEAATESQPS